MDQEILLKDTTSFKASIKINSTYPTFVTCYFLADLCIAISFIEESVPHAWFNRRGFVASRKLLILQWLMFGSILLLGYKSTLLATLIPINYEKPINTVDDLANSNMPLLIAKKTAPHWLLATDPRDAVKRIFRKSVLYPFNGTVPPWVRKRYS